MADELTPEFIKIADRAALLTALNRERKAHEGTRERLQSVLDNAGGLIAEVERLREALAGLLDNPCHCEFQSSVEANRHAEAVDIARAVLAREDGDG